MYAQAQHIDLDYYDVFYGPEAILETHRQHLTRWHGKCATGGCLSGALSSGFANRRRSGTTQRANVPENRESVSYETGSW